MHSNDNRVCVGVDTDHKGHHFMNVHKPDSVTISIYESGTVVINVNDSCVFRIQEPANIRVENQLCPTIR